MFKFLVLSAILCQGICEVFGQEEAENLESRSDTMPDLLENGSKIERDPRFKGQYFYSPHQTFYINSPSAWKWPTSLGNADKEVRADYTVTMGIGAHKIHRRRLPWNSARQICVQEGGHLADIRTMEEAIAIKTLMTANSVDSVWIGFHDMFQEGDWISVLDEPLARMKWSPWSKKFGTNPDNAGGKENCAVFISSHGGINDDNCGTQFPFVCKISA